MQENVIEIKNLTKKFGNFTANKNISLSVKKNEIYSILGENGAGKTTLMNMLYGLFLPSSGEILINDNLVKMTNPSVAMSLGIGMIHQHFMLIEDFTVAENIMLGKEICSFLGVLDRKKANKEIEALSKKYLLDINPNSKVSSLSVGARQKIEILKILYRGADIIILDEPTAVLTPQEIKEFVKITKNLQEQGKTIILITHKLKEIKELASRCAIIRKGTLIEVLDVGSVTDKELAEAMVGKPIVFDLSFKKEDLKEQKTVLQVENLNVLNDNGINYVSNLNLQIKTGQIIGIAGVEGNGQKEFIEALVGLRKVSSGSIKINEKDITNKSPKEIINYNVSYIPKDRQKDGLVLDFSIMENMVLRSFDGSKYSKNGLLKFDKIKEYTQDKIKEYDIRPPVSSKKTKELSGGNQQKIILAREISRNPELIIASQPTRGLDVGAIENIHDFLIKQRNNGKAVLLISFELEEVMSLSDKIAVIYKGQIIDIVDIKGVTEEMLGIMMLGKKIKSKNQL